jgi:hypothetical protein
MKRYRAYREDGTGTLREVDADNNFDALVERCKATGLAYDIMTPSYSRVACVASGQVYGY